MKKTTLVVSLIISVIIGNVSAQTFKTLRGTKYKVAKAYEEAVAHDFTFMRDANHINRFTRLGLLEKIPGNENYSLYKVSYPYVRPASKLFIERLSSQHRKAIGEKLVVTSAVRTTGQKLWNGSSKSVHPTGMAIDFRVPKSNKSRKWLEDTFLILQSRGVVIATREHNPPHYHIVVLPRQYQSYVVRKTTKR